MLTLKNLESLKSKKIASSKNERDSMNLSDVFSAMIKQAGNCKNYASDVLIDIDQIKMQIAAMQKNETITRYVGYREMGTDHLEYILCRDTLKDYYFAMHKITITLDRNNFCEVILYDLNIKQS